MRVGEPKSKSVSYNSIKLMKLLDIVVTERERIKDNNNSYGMVLNIL